MYAIRSYYAPILLTIRASSSARRSSFANSRTMHFNEKGIALDEWEKLLANGLEATPDAFFENVKKLNLRNT